MVGFLITRCCLCANKATYLLYNSITWSLYHGTWIPSNWWRQRPRPRACCCHLGLYRSCFGSFRPQNLYTVQNHSRGWPRRCFYLCIGGKTRFRHHLMMFRQYITPHFSQVLVVICASVITASVKKGMGRHAYYLSPEQRVQATKINFIANPFGIMAYSLPNISVAIFLNRILSPNRWRKSLLYGVTIAQSVIAGISCIILFVQCRPSKSLWDPAVPSTCLPSLVITGYSYFVGCKLKGAYPVLLPLLLLTFIKAYSAFTDIFLAIVPITAFWKLQMKLKTKIGLCLLMGMTALWVSPVESWFDLPLLTSRSAAICAIIKTTKLNELAVLNDFTCQSIEIPFVESLMQKRTNFWSYVSRHGWSFDMGDVSLIISLVYCDRGLMRSLYPSELKQTSSLLPRVYQVYGPSLSLSVNLFVKVTAKLFCIGRVIIPTPATDYLLLSPCPWVSMAAPRREQTIARLDLEVKEVFEPQTT